MSIAIHIENPIDDKENNFYIPFATQSCYENIWLKAAEELNLELIPFLEGLDVDLEAWLVLKQEIMNVVQWVKIDLEKERFRDEICERASFVIDTLDRVFTRDGVVVNFG